MHSSELVKGLHCQLPVDKEKSKANFFTVYTDDLEEVNLPKLKFQRDMPIPDMLDIYVKDVKDGYYFLGQDLSVIIPRFYKEGEEYLFKIKNKKIGKEGSYDVEDENGLYFTVNKAPNGLVRGKTIKCRVGKINNVFVQLKYAGMMTQKLALQFRSPEQWLETIGKKKMASVIRNILENEPDLSPALHLLEACNAEWLFTALQLFSQGVTKFLIDANGSKKQMARIRAIMEMAENICLYIIQKSDYLRGCNPEQRAELQHLLSGYVEMFLQYDEAARLIANNEDEAFIDGIFENLKQSGFLYHPSRQFRIMMTILRLRPDLIKTRLASLFDALHSWPMSNWKEEPFRSALVDQLEIYISENCEQLNSLPMNENESGVADKQLNHIVRSIAIQSLLANSKDKVDLAHNKTMFYRFLSNYRTQDVEDLLYKSVGALLGNDFAGDFSWDDTKKFQMLQEKASTLKGSGFEIALPPKVYSTQTARIEIRPKEITIREPYTTDETSVLPYNLISWMSPKIILNERVRTPSNSKKNNLKAYEDMWINIENYLFPPSEVNSTTEVEIRKSRPEDGDEVWIYIDDFNIDRSRKVGHQMQFHCVIADEAYEGEGWLTACPEDFLPWLDEKDFPVNYDGDLRIFADENGIPLIYPAKVKNSGEELHFTMKKEIEEHLKESVSLNDVSHATIRHIDWNNKRYVCLSDNGYTLLVDFDTNNTGYEVGTHIMVKYRGMHRDYRYNYMEGEIVEFIHGPEDVYSKINPLRSIFQTMGEQQERSRFDDDNQVIEAQEVMTREEMREIILMLQRRAYAEKEYLQAYNYLALGALLAKAIEDNELRKELKIHQNLLSQLQYYANNSVVDYEELSKQRENVKGHAILQKIYTKLDIVASISRPERNNRLWELTTQEDETEKVLASLVLSLNLLPEEENFDAVRKNLRAEISRILNVNSTEYNLKYYGEEDQHLEFKSSLVFTNKKEDHMAANRESQEREILEMICGFLNSQGGVLYIGVNDSGYEAGLAEDLRYRRSRGLKASIDGMIVDLTNVIHNNLDGYAEDHIRISSDPESKKGVIKVEVDPVERPVAFRGLYYVRNSSSTRPKLGKDLEDFLAMRSRDYNDFMDRQRLAAEEIRKAQEEAERKAAEAERRERERQEAEALRNAAMSRPRSIDEAAEAEKSDATQPAQEESPLSSSGVMTGRHRLNVLHDYEEGYVHPKYYLHFNTDDTFYITRDDQYTEFEDDKRLVLAVKDKESECMVVCTFEDGTVTRTPLEELEALVDKSKEKDQRMAHFGESALTAVNIADKDLCLLTFLENPSNNYLHVRIDPVEELALSHNLKSPGKRLIDIDYRILRQDIITKEKAAFLFPKIEDVSRRTLGTQVKFSNLGESVKEKIDYYIAQIAATVEN